MRDAGITVSTAGLDRAAWTVGQAAASAARLADGTREARTRCSDTGGPALDAAVDEFLEGWSRGLRLLAEDLSLLQRYLTGAAAEYRWADAQAMPDGPREGRSHRPSGLHQQPRP